MLCAEEPDELIAHVRICGGAGGQPLALPGRLAKLISKLFNLVFNRVYQKQGRAKTASTPFSENGLSSIS